MFGTLEHVPEPGESVEHGGWRFAAEEIDGRRIRLVRITPLAPDERGANGVRAVGGRVRRQIARWADRPSQSIVVIRLRRTVRSTCTFPGRGDLTGWQGRARHRGVEGDRQGDRGGFAGLRRQGDAEQPQAGPARSGGRRDRRRDGRLRRQRRRPRRRSRLRRRHARDLRRARHPRQQRSHEPVLRCDARGRPGPLRQDVPGQPPRPAVLVAAGVGALVPRVTGRDPQHRLDGGHPGRVRPWCLQRHEGGAHPPHPPAGWRARSDKGRRDRSGTGEDGLLVLPRRELR